MRVAGGAKAAQDGSDPTVHSCKAGALPCLLSEPGYKVQVEMEDLESCLFPLCGPASQRKTPEHFAHFLQPSDEGGLFPAGRASRSHLRKPGCSAGVDVRSQFVFLCFSLRPNKSEPLLLNLAEPVRARQPCLFEK